MAPLHMLVLPLAASAVLTKEDKMACPYYQTSGCMLDQLEKVCEGEADEMLQPQAPENIWMCCCPQPYLPCSLNESDKLCVQSISDEIRESGTLSIAGLLKVRSKLLTSKPTCDKFFMDLKGAECGKWPKAMPQLMCEMLTFQWEELGDGNEPEFAQYDCPMIKANQAKNGDKRKNHALTWDPKKREL
mmetsp:Transcript_45807/g.85499  ORF Transcript_45807/g.85499 Transcript_45807/m.85499 type:complete len:188 (+) Transcript_45807:84-647(+)